MVKKLSYRQSQAIRFWISGSRKSKADALRKSGYSDAIIRQPHKVFGSIAVRRELERLGHGSFGILNGQKPKELVQPVKIETKSTFDISSLTTEQIQNIREQFENIKPRNPTTSIGRDTYKENSCIPVNDLNRNVFGENLSGIDYQEKKMKMSDFSSM